MNYEVLIEDEHWYTLPWEDVIQKAVHECSKIWLHGGNLCIALSNDANIQFLNKTYRKVDKPTNVLAFKAWETLSDKPLILGDVIIAFETVQKESIEQNKPFDAHLIHLVVHGVLHLLGYDHQQDDEAQTMENLEITILKTMGFDDPYVLKD